MIEFIAGALVGFSVATIIGRAKFLQAQNQVRNWRMLAEKKLEELRTERNINEGLTETLDDVAQRTRIKA